MLVSLDLSFCDVGAEGAAALGAMLKGNKGLRRLMLASSRLGTSGRWRSGAADGVGRQWRRQLWVYTGHALQPSAFPVSISASARAAEHVPLNTTHHERRHQYRRGLNLQRHRQEHDPSRAGPVQERMRRQGRRSPCGGEEEPGREGRGGEGLHGSGLHMGWCYYSLPLQQSESLALHATQVLVSARLDITATASSQRST